MTTLFSPVGTADPFTQLGDGAMIHIVRYYQPSKVILFFSPALGLVEKHDARYSEAIRLISEYLNIDMPEIQCVYSEDPDVYKFDTYISEFEQILSAERESNSEEEILVNVSSGTAGMSQALVSLGSFGRLGLRLLQVVTPKHGINGRHDREDILSYELKQMWEWTQEIETAPDAECRIVEVECPNFGDKLLIENVITLVNKFEYASALDIYLQVTQRNAEVETLLAAAQNRLNLACKGSDAKTFKLVGIPYSPEDQITEYIEVMNVRMQQGHFSECLLMLTPVIDNLLRKHVEVSKVPLESFLQEEKNGKLSDRLDIDKLRQNNRLAEMMGIDPYLCKSPFVNSYHLLSILENCSSDRDLINNFNDLICIQKDCRNLLAHTLAKTSKTELESKMRVALVGAVEGRNNRIDVSFLNYDEEIRRRRNFTFDDLMILVAKLNKKPLKNIYKQLNQKIAEVI
jgi:CRISPR type III-A/MTUBE-associated protein Csm6